MLGGTQELFKGALAFVPNNHVTPFIINVLTLRFFWLVNDV
jgi:hypothetical protein